MDERMCRRTGEWALNYLARSCSAAPPAQHGSMDWVISSSVDLHMHW